MKIHPDILSQREVLKGMRHHLHAHPEVGTQTPETAAWIAHQLDGLGIAHEPIGENSVLGRVEGRGPGKTIAFRVDLDALEIQEESGVAHVSQVSGRMHACGHDGHTVTLLAFAAYLANHRAFDGTVLLLFQSGEEGFGGARKVIDDGLFEKYPIDLMFGYHNWPGVGAGKVVVHSGACMASEDRFDIRITGRSGHASMPHGCIEPFAAVADIIKGAQSIIPRKVSAHDKAVISITQVHGGSAYNIIPDGVVVRGNVRTLDPSVQDLIETSLGDVVEGVAKVYGVEIDFEYHRNHPVLLNSTPEFARAAAVRVVGEGQLLCEEPPAMGSEDFAFYMERTRGCFLWIGNGESSPLLHNSHYDFNDEVALVGASVFVEILNGVL